jgi:hypothetical protein
MANATDELLIGIATIDITPPVGATLVGYRPRTSDALGHPLRAEALACRSGDAGWILVTSDTIGYSRDHVNNVRKLITDATGVPAESIMVSGTHTHSGPATLFGASEKTDTDLAYLDELKKNLAQVATEAWNSAAPGSFEVAHTAAPDLGSNRRIQQDDGTWGNEWNDPDGRHPGYFDPLVVLVAVRRPDGSCDALLVNYGCHPVTLGPSSLAISPDYPGYVKDAIEANGSFGTCLFALAGGANINPRVCIQVGEEFPKTMGQRLADIVLKATADLSPVATGKVAARQEPWDIVRTRTSPKAVARSNHQKGDTICTEIQALRAGELGIVGIPGELFSEFYQMLRTASPTTETLVVSVANDFIGYLPTNEGAAQGAYEGGMSPTENIEDLLMETARKAFKAIG